jgi:predicted negative regulator of RcsB-dependent stress response
MRREHLEARLIKLLMEHRKLEKSIELLKPKIESYAQEYYHMTGEKFVYKDNSRNPSY